MIGIGPPLVTPFNKDGEVDHDRLSELVDWVEQRGVDFIVPCGTTSEAELMTATERKAVIETVTESASVPVLAGTGNPGKKETLHATEEAASVGAAAALVVTPFYYSFSQSELEAYYREVADEASIPIYLYSVPAFTDTTLEPETAGQLASHQNIVGMKDSKADIAQFIRTIQRTEDEEFDLLVGSASVLSQALDVGGTGGINALANLYPERLAEVYAMHQAQPEEAKALNQKLVELNTAVTATYGITGLKLAMRYRGAPAGYGRTPHTPPTDAESTRIKHLVDSVEDLSQ